MANTFLDRAERGAAALSVGSAAPTVPPTLGLKWEWANDEAVRVVPDELVQGLLVRGGVSLLYGDSNSGKTFLALDIAASIARGVQWLDRQVEPGLVVYIASESPASPRTRLQAYRAAFKCETPNLVIVTSPIDLFSSDNDKSDIVNLVKEIENNTGKTCQLVIVDTLARVSAGANENSGEDMGRIIRRVDALREASGAHVMLIHHAGKDQAKGARGWSGLRAAVDTEIEVTADEATRLRCAEVTKQRDIAGKGARIGFKLEVVNLGTTKWAEPFTSCVVFPTEAPQRKAKGKRVSAVGCAIVEFLSGSDAFVQRRAIKDHLVQVHNYNRTAIYNEISKLVGAGRLIQSFGAVRLAALSSMSSTVVETTNADSRQVGGKVSSTVVAPYRDDDNDDTAQPDQMASVAETSR